MQRTTTKQEKIIDNLTSLYSQRAIKSRRQIITSAGKDVENSEPHSLLVEIKWCSYFENSLAVLQEVKHRVI